MKHPKRISALLLAACLTFGLTALASSVPDASEPDPSVPFIPAPIGISSESESSAPSVPEPKPMVPEPRGALLEVTLPTGIPFTIDPFEISGRGQVYSEPMKVTNHSGEPVEIEIRAAAYTFAAAEGFAALTNPRDPLAESPDKEIFLVLRRVDAPTEQVLSQTPAPEPIRFTLEPGRDATFELTGSVNPNPASPWKKGDVHVSMTFSVRPLMVMSLPVEPPPPPTDMSSAAPVSEAVPEAPSEQVSEPPVSEPVSKAPSEAVPKAPVSGASSQ